MRFLLPVALLAVPFLVAPAHAESQQQAPAAKLDPRDPNAVKCRRLEVTGSLVRRERVCRTNAEWRAVSEQQNRDADDLITRSRSGMNPSGD